VPLGHVLALSWCGEVSLAGTNISVLVLYSYTQHELSITKLYELYGGVSPRPPYSYREGDDICMYLKIWRHQQHTRVYVLPQSIVLTRGYSNINTKHHRAPSLQRTPMDRLPTVRQTMLNREHRGLTRYSGLAQDVLCALTVISRQGVKSFLLNSSCLNTKLVLTTVND